LNVLGLVNVLGLAGSFATPDLLIWFPGIRVATQFFRSVFKLFLLAKNAATLRFLNGFS